MRFKDYLNEKYTLAQAKKSAKQLSLDPDNDYETGIVSKMGNNYIVSADSSNDKFVVVKYKKGKEI